MRMGYYLLRDGVPVEVDMMTWAQEFEYGDIAARRVAETQLEGCWISTVFLGTDHQFGFGPPLLFETMVFCKDWPEMDTECERYTTLDQARRGHDEMVKRVLEAARHKGRNDNPSDEAD